jgi:hypothetical protein
MERIRNEAVIDISEILSRHLHGMTGENHEIVQK